MNILVTGGAGFIGSHLVNKLVHEGGNVLVLDNLNCGVEKNINKKADFIFGDIRDEKILNNAIDSCDVIYHLAAFTSVPESFINEKDCIAINEIAFKNILSMAAEKNVKKVILSSSSAVYPDDCVGPFNESSKTNPSSPYGKSKLYDEKILNEWCNEQKDRTGLALRYFNVYGPRQEADSDYASVIPKFLKKITSQQPIYVYGDGNQTRDFIYVDDVVSANILGLQLSSYNLFSVGTGIEYSVNELVNMIKTITKKNIDILNKPLPFGDALRSCADNSKLIGFGWKTSTRIKKGLQLTWQAIEK